MAMPERCIDVPSSSFVVSAYRGRGEIADQLADEWRELCNEAADDQPFYRPEWIRAFFRFFVPRKKVVIVAARLDGRLRLMLPLIEEKGTFSKMPVRKLKAPVNSCAGRFDAIYSAGPEGEAAIQATWKFLKELDGWDLLQFRDALQGSAVSRLAAAARADGLSTIQIDDKPSPYVPVPTDPELLKQLPVNARLRRQLRQIRREIAEKSLSLKLHRVETADPKALNRFYELEASGWKGKERTAILFRHKIAPSSGGGHFSMRVPRMALYKQREISGPLTPSRRCLSEPCWLDATRADVSSPCCVCKSQAPTRCESPRSFPNQCQSCRIP